MSQDLHGSVDPGERKEDFELMKNIALRTELMLALAEIQPFYDLEDALELMKYYVSNSGGEYGINYPKMLKESNDAAEHYKNELEDAVDFVVRNKNRFKICPSPFVSTSEVGSSVSVEDSRNWNYAIHSYTTWGLGENASCNCWRCDFDWTLNLRDLYDWNENSFRPLMRIGVSQAEMKLMHIWGIYQEFKVTGKCKTHIAIKWSIENNKVSYEYEYAPCQ